MAFPPPNDSLAPVIAPRRRSPALRILVFGTLALMAAIPVAVGAFLHVALSGTFDGLDAPRGLLNAPRLDTPSVDTPDWSSRQRVNVLLLGTDRREGETDLPRSDTIMVLTIDPQSRTAGVLSLPRDLWVTIPGYGNDRINAAFELGERARPQGGPELTRKTVEGLLGVPIHHYAIVGFTGFTRLVDQVGGVVVDVERPIKDDEYPDQNYSTRRIYFQPGLQRLSGETALWYVRTRHADSDFGRARRQQQFLLALRKQVLQLELLPRTPAILASLSDTLRTDFRPQEILALAGVAREIDTSKLVNRVVDETMTTHWVTPAGAQVEIPDREAIRRVVLDVFGKPA